MPYIKRDEAGQIISVSLSQESDDQEFIDAENAQLAAFFEDARASADSLRESDSDLVRVLEDLIEMLTAKGIILFTELPESAQQKIMLRKRLRKDRSNSLDLLGDE
ncbi:MAG: tryptophan synthase subunit beta [Pseudomonadales bacterium]